MSSEALKSLSFSTFAETNCDAVETSHIVPETSATLSMLKFQRTLCSLIEIQFPRVGTHIRFEGMGVTKVPLRESI
jgi:hypothetical protein